MLHTLDSILYKKFKMALSFLGVNICTRCSKTFMDGWIHESLFYWHMSLHCGEFTFTRELKKNNYSNNYLSEKLKLLIYNSKDLKNPSY